jgi:hypothetical protein
VTATAGGALGATHTKLATRLGKVTVVREGGALTGLYFPRHWPRPDRTAFGPRVDEGFEDVARQLGEYLGGDRRVFELPVKVKGTEFDRRVWELIAGVPYGKTTTYGDLARAGGRDRSARRRCGGGPQPAVHRDPLPPGDRQHGQAHWLRGRPGPQAHPARDRARAGPAAGGCPCGGPLVGHRSPAVGEKFLAAISRDGHGARLQGAPLLKGSS